MATEQRSGVNGYDRLSQGFHWLSAVLIIAALMPLGFYAYWLGDGPARAAILDHWHKPLGLLVIAISVLRLGWKAIRSRLARRLPPRRAPRSGPRAQARG